MSDIGDDYRGDYKQAMDAALNGRIGFYADFDSARQEEVWRLLSQTLIVIGGLTGAAGLFILDLGSPRVAILVTVIFALTAVLARSSLMAALAVLSLAGSLGARTANVVGAEKEPVPRVYACRWYPSPPLKTGPRHVPLAAFE